MDYNVLEQKTLSELRMQAKELGVHGFSTMKKGPLVVEIMRTHAR